MDSLSTSEQELRFLGVGAHHQNGVAKRAIRTVTEKARTMMQHAFIHLPDKFQVQLWPFALDYACWLHNHSPSNTNGWAPLELFCGTRVDCQHLQRARVWGCPSYVLSPTLQDGKKDTKWAPRASRGQFLGFSKNHSSMIGLLRNKQTGSITPQFHVVFDELFSTVHSLEEDDDSTWIELFVSERNYYGPDEDEEDADSVSFPDINPSWLPIAESIPSTVTPTLRLPSAANSDPATTVISVNAHDDEVVPAPDDIEQEVTDDGADAPDGTVYDIPLDILFAPNACEGQTDEFSATNRPIIPCSSLRPPALYLGTVSRV